MGIVLRLFFFFLILGLGTIFIVYMIYSFLTGTKSEKREIKRDLDLLKDKVEKSQVDLVPVDAEEIKIIARQPKSKVKKHSSATVMEGVFETIYQEPVYSFISKSYVSGNRLSFFKSVNETYKFLTIDGLTQVFINNALLGTINSKSQFILKGAANPSASILRSKSTDLAKISISDTIVAHFTSETELDASINDRLFSLFSKLESKDEHIFMSLVFHHILANKQL